MPSTKLQALLYHKHIIIICKMQSLSNRLLRVGHSQLCGFDCKKLMLIKVTEAFEVSLLERFGAFFGTTLE